MIFANPMHRPCPWEVGDILTTENATPPAQRWPGTQWVQITDRFLYGSTAAGTEGGEATHTLTVSDNAVGGTLCVYATDGRMLSSRTIRSVTMNIAGLPAGVVLLRVSGNGLSPRLLKVRI